MEKFAFLIIRPTWEECKAFFQSPQLFCGGNGYGDEILQRIGWDSAGNGEGMILVSPSGHVRYQGNFDCNSRMNAADRSAWTDFTFMQETEGGKSVCTENEGIIL